MILNIKQKNFAAANRSHTTTTNSSRAVASLRYIFICHVCHQLMLN